MQKLSSIAGFILFIGTVFLLFSCNMPPLGISADQPHNKAINVPINSTLRWYVLELDGDPVFYDLYFGKSPDELRLIAQNLEEPQYKFSRRLEYNTTYYWQVVARDRNGRTQGSVWSFTTTKGKLVARDVDTLHEGYYWYSNIIRINVPAKIYIEFALLRWTHDYPIELFVVKDYYLQKKQFSEASLHEALRLTGTYQFETPYYLPSGEYRIVVDNTDMGSYETDWDGDDDVAVFSIEAYLREH